ncbi:ATP-binding protein [Streptomyces sp. NPDC053431]|uniref:ATP-binding protein n=1 Tax=Streptomyces sp. NPDC053431 TaxID=3365703 RepID=UPI0037D06E27
MTATPAAPHAAERHGRPDATTSPAAPTPQQAHGHLSELPCAWALPHRPQAAATARRIARAALDAWGADENSTDQILLVISELVTNAVEHALPPITLRLDRPGTSNTMHIAVQDGGPAPTEGPWTSSCNEDEHGRGHTIINLLATAHGTHTHPHGTTHWADLPLTA